MVKRDTARTWIACRQCGVAQPLPNSASPGPVLQEMEQAATSFLDAHSKHLLITLFRVEEAPVLADRPLWDPTARVTVQATDGQTDYLITAERPSVEEQRTYHVCEGRLPPVQVEIELVTTEFRSALRKVFGTQTEAAALQRLEAAVQNLVASMDPTLLESAFDDPDHPSVQYADWPDPYRTDLCLLGRRFLPECVAPAWQRFVDEQAVAHGALALKKVARIQRSSEGRSLPAPL